ncbi:MAG: hypothetical protein FJ390_06285, partial [Verrucomicrobia bacterium]|nr:hypothetical protein [Verrucomicrobiota bacterium]
MKKFFFFLFLIPLFAAAAIPESPDVISEHAVEQASSQANNEESPFLIEREDAKQAAAAAAASNTSVNKLYPPRHSISKQIANFCKHLVGTMKSSMSKTPTLRVTVEPALFSVTENSELSVTLKITNDKKEMIMLHFPTNQRLEIVVKDEFGKIVSRWSQDRSFDPTDDTVVINPQESIFYTEKISTTGMENGKSYTLDVSLANQ